ncbi:MAG: cisplatin damage response ATP-dependent DNA ligase [Alphaproteobacteria bacterium]|nr:cisplatin damage response ATP-dependent DNA ligase [Alphaproteobacteria bacterium]
MTPFAELLDGLVYTPSRNGKLRLMGRYFTTVPDPDRGWGLAALTGGLSLASAKPAMLRALAAERTDPVLFALSYDYVGDLAETCALIWPGDGPRQAPRLSEVVDALGLAARDRVPELLAGWLDGMTAGERWALLKLVTGGLRVGVSARLAKTALAEAFDTPLDEIEEVWHGLKPPYGRLFDWLDGRESKPDVSGLPTFRPFMLAHPLEDDVRLDLGAYQVEWKWDGIRVQLASVGGERRLYSRSGDDISATFPDVVEAAAFEGVLDGELLVRAPDGAPAPFNALQQRLNRKTVGRKMLDQHPAFVCAYDILFDGGEDLRALPLSSRRDRLEDFVARTGSERLTLSELVSVDEWEHLARLRAGTRALGIEGLMLKRRDSAYLGGRSKGPWYKWKRDPLTADVVLMYAQRGHGKRSSYYSDYTFGAWRDESLVPVGKAYFGFTDEELRELDRWVRNHTTNRFGPVREVDKDLVLEVAFDSIHPSPRHKSGVAMRFPRIKRIRWDKPAREADRLEALERMIPAQASIA